jgi:hypothetical protein
MRRTYLSFVLFNIFALACSLPGYMMFQKSAAVAVPSATAEPQITATTTVLPSPTETSSPSLTPTATPTQTASLTPTFTATPTITPTSGPTLTPTFSFPAVTVNQQAHCRYGPNTAYLHAADLYAGDIGTVRGRFNLSKWLFVKFDKLNYFCWVAPSVVDVVGDITTVKFTQVYLPGPSVLYNPPHNVSAKRDGNKVSISWDVDVVRRVI